MLSLAEPFGPYWVTAHRFTWIYTLCCYWPSGCRKSQITAGEARRISAEIRRGQLIITSRVMSQNRLWFLFLASERGKAALSLSSRLLIFSLLVPPGPLLLFFFFPGGSVVKNPAANAGDVSSIPASGKSLEKEMATHSNILAWRIPWTE